MAQSTVYTPKNQEPQIPQPVLNGGNYYVAVNGDDGANGSRQAPWRTVAHAIAATQPGDTIWVGPGRYTGFHIKAADSGRADAWRAVRAMDLACKPIFDTTPVLNNRARNSTIKLEGNSRTDKVHHWWLQGLVVEDSPKWGIDVLLAEYIRVSACEAYRSGFGDGSHRTGIFAADTCYYVVEDCISCGNSEHGFYLNNSVEYFIFRRNISRGNAACGFHLNGDADFPGHGLCLHGLYEDNIADGNGRGLPGSDGFGGAGFNLSALHHGIVRNNLSINAYASGMTFFHGNAGDTSRDCDVYNNTIIQGDNPIHRHAIALDTDAGQHKDHPNPFTGQPVDLRFYNNIIGCLGPQQTNVEPSTAIEARHGICFKNNLFIAQPGQGISAPLADDVARQMLADNDYQPDITAVLADPYNGDYAPLPGTPAEGRGADLSRLPRG